jgi:hypothetical protein
METGEKSDLSYAGLLVWDAWITIFGSDYGVIWREEIKF